MRCLSGHKPFTTSCPSTRAVPVLGHQQRRQDSKQRRLSAAVRSDQAEELAGVDGEGHAVERRDGAESLDEGVDRDGVGGRRLSHRSGCGGGHFAGPVVSNWTSAGMPIFSAPPSFGHPNLDGVDEVRALVPRLNRRRRELGFATRSTRSFQSQLARAAADVDRDPRAGPELHLRELRFGHVRAHLDRVEVGDLVERLARLHDLARSWRT